MKTMCLIHKYVINVSKVYSCLRASDKESEAKPRAEPKTGVYPHCNGLYDNRS